ALDQERRLALRTRLRDRPIPRDEVALCLAVVGAAEEDLAAPRPLLRQEAATPGPRAVDPQRDRPGGLALRITRAGEELAEPAALDQHRRAAGLALLVGGRLRRDLDRAVLAPDELLGVLALRVTGAGEELAVSAPLDHHRRPALLTLVLGRDLLAP